LDQGPRPALLVVSSNLMALCFADAYRGPEPLTAVHFPGPLRSKWRFARTFQDYRSLGSMSTVNSVFLFGSFELQGFPLQPARPVRVSHSAQMSKHPYADDGAEHLAPIKPLAVAWVGSSRPVGLASWIKRLDCASSYSSTSSSRCFQPARPIRQGAKLVLALLTLPELVAVIKSRQTVLLSSGDYCDLVRVTRLSGCHKGGVCGKPVQDRRLPLDLLANASVAPLPACPAPS
jgi:hypothetical protein